MYTHREGYVFQFSVGKQVTAKTMPKDYGKLIVALQFGGLLLVQPQYWSGRGTEIVAIRANIASTVGNGFIWVRVTSVVQRSQV